MITALSRFQGSAALLNSLNVATMQVSMLSVMGPDNMRSWGVPRGDTRGHKRAADRVTTAARLRALKGARPQDSRVPPFNRSKIQSSITFSQGSSHPGRLDNEDRISGRTSHCCGPPGPDVWPRTIYTRRNGLSQEGAVPACRAAMRRGAAGAPERSGTRLARRARRAPRAACKPLLAHSHTMR